MEGSILIAHKVAVRSIKVNMEHEKVANPGSSWRRMSIITMTIHIRAIQGTVPMRRNTEV